MKGENGRLRLSKALRDALLSRKRLIPPFETALAPEGGVVLK